MRNNTSLLLGKLPDNLQNEPEVAALRKSACPAIINIIQLIYQRKNYERDNKAYEFSHASLTAHWQCGLDDTIATLQHADWLKCPNRSDGVVTHDIGRNQQHRNTT